MRRDELLRRKMAEDTAAYTLKPGPKAELDGLREAREESGAIAPRPGACPVRVARACIRLISLACSLRATEQA
mgnify:FL=1